MSFTIDRSRRQSQAAAVEDIKKFVNSLGLPVSHELAYHGATITHEDLPHDHECGVLCMMQSRGTVSPASSIRSASERFHAYIPPSNYGAVLPGYVYRSSYPEQKNFEFIKDLKIKTILTLVPEPITPEYQSFMEEAGIQHFQVHIRANKDGVRIESCEMQRALRLVMDRANHPILIHCNKGKHRTGCTVACIRRILGVDMDAVREEYHIYAGAKARFWDEVFFENFDLNVIMWLARQQGWVKPEVEKALPSPPVSPETIKAVAEMDQERSSLSYEDLTPAVATS